MLNRLIKLFFAPIYYFKTYWIGAAISAGANIIGGIMGSNAAQSAANTQAASQQAALNQQMAIYNQNTANLQPYLGLGQQGATSLQNMIPSLSTGPSTYQPVTSQDIMNNMAPNYQFMLNQGLGANTQNLNVGGGGSNINRSNTIFAENYAQNAYQNALNNYITQQQLGFNQQTANQTNIYNRLAGIAGIGATSGAALAGVGAQTGQQVGATLSNLGTAQASGIVGSTNALTGGLTSAGNTAYLASLLNGNQQNNVTYLGNGAAIPTNQLSNWVNAISQPQPQPQQ